MKHNIFEYQVKRINKTVAEFSKQDGQVTVSSVNQGQVVEHRKEGMDVFKSPDQEMTEITNNFHPQRKE
jgi:hypothetical protein